MCVCFLIPFPVCVSFLISFPVCVCKEHFIYLFLEKGEGKEQERERNINVWLPLMRPLLGTWPATQACALTGNRTGDPSEAGIQTTEPHQPGLLFIYLLTYLVTYF